MAERRVPVKKTHKLYIGGAFPRSESGRSYVVSTPGGEFLANAALGSRKDVRDAVVAARAAQSGWAGATAYNRGQVLYRVAEILEDRRSSLPSTSFSVLLALYHRRQGAIYRFVLHMSRSPAAAEDITQEVFVALLRDGCGYDPDRGTLSGYLFGIARKLLLRQIERGRVDVPLDCESEDAAIPELAVAGSALEDLTHREEIEALPARHWDSASPVPGSGGALRPGGSGLCGRRPGARLSRWGSACTSFGVLLKNRKSWTACCNIFNCRSPSRISR